MVNVAKGLIVLKIRLIQFEGAWKALVLNVALDDNRLVHVIEGLEFGAVVREAQAFIDSYKGATWH